MKLALIASKKHGKDYLADLVLKHKPQYRKIAWADSLKEYCNELYPGLEKYNTPEAKDETVPESWNTNNETPRDIWERVSREKSNEDDRFFHKITLKQIDKLIGETNGNIIITDTRNDWEYNDIKEMGFTVIYITRPGMPVFQGYDERIKKFYKDIKLTYSNEKDGLDFINQLTYLESLENQAKL